MAEASGAGRTQGHVGAAPAAAPEMLPALPRPDARVGLYGGSFDPVHRGHLALARMALQELHLDRLFFIPAACAPLRDAPPVASAADRLALLRIALAVEGNARLGVLEIELAAGGVNYTVETLRRLRAAWPQAELSWLIGADQLAQFDRWREPREIARLAELAVFDRAGCPPPVAPAALAADVRWRHFGAPGEAASSQEIRRCRRAGEPWAFWLPPAVATAIEERGLYR